MKKGMIRYFPLIAALAAMDKIKIDDEPMIPARTYGSLGWTGFTGSNADKKKHFNKKRHGKMLKRKHKKA